MCGSFWIFQAIFFILLWHFLWILWFYSRWFYYYWFVEGRKIQIAPNESLVFWKSVITNQVFLEIVIQAKKLIYFSHLNFHNIIGWSYLFMIAIRNLSSKRRCRQACLVCDITLMPVFWVRFTALLLHILGVNWLQNPIAWCVVVHCTRRNHLNIMLFLSFSLSFFFYSLIKSSWMLQIQSKALPLSYKRLFTYAAAYINT